MKQRILAVSLAAASALALMAAPAAAHINQKAAEAGMTRDTALGDDTPGFVGPTRLVVSDDIYVRAHSGMQCGALSNPHMNALPPGFPDGLTFTCPSPNKSFGS